MKINQLIKNAESELYKLQDVISLFTEIPLRDFYDLIKNENVDSQNIKNLLDKKPKANLFNFQGQIVLQIQDF